MPAHELYPAISTQITFLLILGARLHESVYIAGKKRAFASIKIINAGCPGDNGNRNSRTHKDQDLRIRLDTVFAAGVEAGIPGVEAGIPGVEAGIPGVEAGIPVAGAGIAGVEAGIPVAGAGIAGVEAGSVAAACTAGSAGGSGSATGEPAWPC
jgi:hypothetical protein